MTTLQEFRPQLVSSNGEQHMAVPVYNVFSHHFPGNLVANRETKTGSASLVLFRINYSPEHYMAFTIGVSSCKLWIGPAWLPSVLEIKWSAKHCKVCTLSKYIWHVVQAGGAGSVWWLHWVSFCPILWPGHLKMSIYVSATSSEQRIITVIFSRD